MPYQNIYSSTKAFVRNYTRALNVELKGTGIQATAVCPGWMNTELIERGKTEAKKATHRFLHMVTPQVVAKKAMKDVKKGKRYIGVQSVCKDVPPDSEDPAAAGLP